MGRSCNTTLLTCTLSSFSSCQVWTQQQTWSTQIKHLASLHPLTLAAPPLPLSPTLTTELRLLSLLTAWWSATLEIQTASLIPQVFLLPDPLHPRSKVCGKAHLNHSCPLPRKTPYSSPILQTNNTEQIILQPAWTRAITHTPAPWCQVQLRILICVLYLGRMRGKLQWLRILSFFLCEFSTFLLVNNQT